MQRTQALGLAVLMCLTASTVNGAEPKKKTTEEQQRAEQQRQAEEAERQAEAMKQQAQAELEEAQRKKEELEKQLQAQQQQQQQQEAQAKKPTGPEPKLDLPIRYYVYTAIFSGLGYATGFLSRGPERDLRDPAKHPTQDKTLSLYRKARYGGILSKGFYGVSGTFGAYAAYKTQSAVRQYLTAKAQQSAALQREANQRLAQARSPEEQKDLELANSLLLPPEPVVPELLVVPEPPPLQAGFFLSPAGDASVSLSVSF
jgi:chemotaxis protein histidine kinase CheA